MMFEKNKKKWSDRQIMLNIGPDCPATEKLLKQSNMIILQKRGTVRLKTY